MASQTTRTVNNNVLCFTVIDNQGGSCAKFIKTSSKEIEVSGRHYPSFCCWTIEGHKYSLIYFTFSLISQCYSVNVSTVLVALVFPRTKRPLLEITTSFANVSGPR